MEQSGNSSQDAPEIHDASSMLNASVIGEHTQLAAPLSDSAGREISADELQKMLGAESEKTIGVLKNMTTIGMGGIGTVFSAHDPVLHREIAIKILRPAYRNQLNYVTSFIREARITAQIDHPNVIPVHKLGIFDDTGAYFTMKRIRGITLASILRKLQEGDKQMLSVYTRQRLLEIFISVCNGVAFAHSKGIIHRDLKPSNVMVGDYGEVFIADWGLAIYREENDNSHKANKIQLGLLPDEQPSEHNDGEGNKISGTPAFMAPEQVTGKDDELDEQIDVYALGTILYSILTWEQSPYDGVSTVSQLMHKVVQRKFLRPRRRAPKRKIPFELEAITLKAMHQDKARRYSTVLDLLDDVRNYLGKYPVSAYAPAWYRFFKLIRRHPLIPVTLLAALITLAVWNGSEALQHYMECRSRMVVIETLLDDCEKARLAAVSNRKKLNEHFTSSGSTETYGDAAVLRSRYLLSSNEFNVAVNSAWENLLYLLQQGGDNSVLVPLFSRLFNDHIQYATAVNNQNQLKLVNGHLQQLPNSIKRQVFAKSPALKKYVQSLERDEGELLIRSEQPLKELSVRKLPAENKAENIAGKASDAADKIDLINGQKKTLKSGLYTITAVLQNGRKLVFQAAVIRDQLETVQLDIPEQIPDNMLYIPGGSFIFGDLTFDEQFARTNLPGFFIDRNEVTIGEYLEFWKSLKDPLQREYYRAWVSESFTRKLKPLWDENGKVEAPYTEQMPVIGITTEAIEAYCAYRSKLTKLNYRLPTALEWEKAARGVDGREYVWGSEFVSGNACINMEPEKKRDLYPAEVGKYLHDRSIYGVMDMTGNARELVTNPGRLPYYMVKGGSFNLSKNFARLTSYAYTSNFSDVGFRCVVDLNVEDGNTAGSKE